MDIETWSAADRKERTRQRNIETNKPSKEERLIEKQIRGINTKKIYKKRVKEIENVEVIKKEERNKECKERNRKYLGIVWLIDVWILYCANFITKKLFRVFDRYTYKYERFSGLLGFRYKQFLL